jgi:hypothetical protein
MAQVRFTAIVLLPAPPFKLHTDTTDPMVKPAFGDRAKASRRRRPDDGNKRFTLVWLTNFS